MTARWRLSNRAPLNLRALDEHALAGAIDHSILDPWLARSEVDAALDVAIEWQTATVCCRPTDLEYVARRLRGTLVGPTTVVGFPHGTTTAATKEREAIAAIDLGAVELDLVADIGAIRGGDLAAVKDELAGICYAVAPTPVKVILDTGRLTTEQLEAACAIAVKARAAFVENGSDYSGCEADPAGIAVLRRAVGERLGVKAAGRIATLDELLAVLAAGACRVGTPATAAILREWRVRGPTALEATLPRVDRPGSPTGSCYTRAVRLPGGGPQQDDAKECTLPQEGVQFAP